MKIEKNIFIFIFLFVVLSWAVSAFALFEPNQKDSVNPSQMTPTEYEKSRQPKFHPGEIIVKIKEGKGGIDSIQVLNRANEVTSIEPLVSNLLSPEDLLKEKKQEFTKLEVLEKESLPKQSNNKEETAKELATIKQQKNDLQVLIDQYQALVERIAIRKQRASSSEKENVTLENIYLIKFRDQNIDINEMIAQYSTDPAVEYAEPNYEVKTFGLLPNDRYVDPDQNDTWSTGAWGQNYPDLWGADKIDAEKTFDFKKEEKTPVIVAVVDTGVYYQHPDIKQNMWGLNGSYGYDFVNNDNDPIDDNGHGTHVAGTIAAIGNNTIGIIGVNPKAKIMAVKGLDSQGSGYDDKLAKGIKYAVDYGADVINCSWGGSGCSAILKDAVKYALNKGCVVVAAAGNNNVNFMKYTPANIEGVIRVAATDHNDKKSSYSNWGQKIDISAPGGDGSGSILSLLAPNSYLSEKYPSYIVGTEEYKYLRLSGTSMATPHVCAVLSLLISRYPNETIQHLRARIKASADMLYPDNYQGTMGAGRINVDKALKQGICPYFELNNIVLTEVKGDKDQIPESGEKIQLVVTLKNIWQNTTAVTGIISTNDPAVAAINQPQSIFGAINDGASKQGTPFEFTIATINYDTPVMFKLLITTASGSSQTIYFKVDLGVRNLTPETTDPQDEANISGNIVVWTNSDSGSCSISYRDIRETANKSVSFSGRPFNPDVSGNTILFLNWYGGQALFTYNIATGQLQQQTGNAAKPYVLPAISGNYIIWQDKRHSQRDEIYIRNINDKPYEDKQLTFDYDYYQGGVAIDGFKCVWEDSHDDPNEKYEIYFYDIKSPAVAAKRLTNDSLDQWRPRISGNNIVCFEYPNGNADITLYEVNDDINNLIVKKTIITTDSDWQWYPDISGNKIVWADYRKGNYDIYYCQYLGQDNVGKATAITTDKSLQANAKIDGNIIIWLDERNGALDVYMTELQSNSLDEEKSKE